MDLNKVTLIGNLVHDPERVASSKHAAVTFTLATSYKFQDVGAAQQREVVDFHAVTAFGRLAEVIVSYLKKGAKVYIEGRLRTREYTDKAEARKRVTEIIADNLIMLGSHQRRLHEMEERDEEPEGFSREEALLE